MEYFTETSNRNSQAMDIILNWVFRENLLIIDDSMKLADFGSCRGIYSKHPYTVIELL